MTDPVRLRHLMTMVVGLAVSSADKSAGAATQIERAAMIGVLQLALVLATWDLLPLRLWT